MITRYLPSVKSSFLTLILITLIVTIVAFSQLSVSFVQSAYSANAATTSSSSSCITYSPIARVITITCGSATLTDIYNHFHNNNILNKQSPGIWLLDAKIVIAKGATLRIDSTDTKWLKISSPEGTSSSVTSVVPNNIDVHGTLKIDSIKLTSWDSMTNNYAITNGTRHDQGVGRSDATISGAPRPYITVEKDATGTADITNSEIAYIGYEKGSFSGTGTAGLNYYGGGGSTLVGNNIHDLYFGFYSSGVGGIVIENNQVHHNTIYGLDPHTGTHDMIIRKNIIHDNGQFSIICSLNCNNITIENNLVYHDGNKNTGAGIMFSRNMVNSVARNNIVHDEASGISISESHSNQISNNTISNSGSGITVKNSTNNVINANTIINSIKGIDTSNAGGAGNSIYNNHFINTPSSSTSSSSSSSSQASNIVSPTNNQAHGTSKHHTSHSLSGHKVKPGLLSISPTFS